jgi:CRP-like cAMP-binding protein
VADDVFLLRSGRLVASVRTSEGDVAIATIEAGEMIGEVTVVTGGRRTATLAAEGDAVVIVVAREEFERWLDLHPERADAVASRARERVDRSQVAVMAAELMGVSDPQLVQQIVDRVEFRRLEPGATLFQQGDPSDAAHFVVSGRLLVVIRSDDGAEALVRELGRGEVVGELGLLDAAPRSATVRAIRETTLATFRTELFEELVHSNPAVMLHVARSVVARLRRPPNRLADRAASITVAMATEAGPPQLLPQMLAEIQRHGSVVHLSSARVDHLLNRADISQGSDGGVGVPRLAEFMHEADVGNDHVLLQTDRDCTPWTVRALRQPTAWCSSCRPSPTTPSCAGSAS